MDESELQRWMIEQLRSRRDLTAQPEVAARAAELFRSGLRVSPIEQLEIYREQFWLRHTAALEEDFPLLSRWLGEQAWRRLIEEYLAHTALASFSLRDLGAELASFTEERDWLERPALAADVARFEWALVDVFDATDATPVTAAELAAVAETDWEAARLSLSPALRLLELRYPVVELVDRREPGSPLEPAPCRLAVYRDGFEVKHVLLSAAAFSVLTALGQGLGLVAACERALSEGRATPEALAAEVSGWFETWSRLGFVVGVRSA